MASPSLLFEVLDPRKKTIRCTREQWDRHVIQNKPFMVTYLEEVKRTLQNPDFISQDVNNKTRQCYYSRKIKTQHYLKVVVNLDSENEASVITAYLADSGKRGERIIWPPLSK